MCVLSKPAILHLHSPSKQFKLRRSHPVMLIYTDATAVVVVLSSLLHHIQLSLQSLWEWSPFWANIPIRHIRQLTGYCTVLNNNVFCSCISPRITWACHTYSEICSKTRLGRMVMKLNLTQYGIVGGGPESMRATLKCPYSAFLDSLTSMIFASSPV